MTKKNIIATTTALSLLGLPFLTAHAEEDKTSQLLVTASRTPISQNAVGSAISVLTAEDLEAKQIDLVSDALRSLPSVAVSQSGSKGGQTQIRMRGAEGNHTLVLIDGIEASNPTTGEFDFASLLSHDIERIEVLRGEQSVLWGSEAIGGVINIITKKGDGPLQGSVQLNAGSFGSKSASVSARTGTEVAHIAFNAAFHETDGINVSRFGSEKDDYDNTSFHLKGGWNPSDILEFGLVARHIDTSTQFDSDIDFDGLIDDVDRRNDLTQSLARAFAKLSLLDGKWEHNISAAVTTTDLENFIDGVSDGNSEGRKIKYDYQTTLFFDTPSFGNASHHLTVVAEVEEEDYKNRSVSLPGANQDKGMTNEAYIVEYGAGFNENLFVNAALRKDDHEGFKDTTTWSLNGSYIFHSSGTRLHASAGTGFKTPTFFELFGFFPAFFAGNPNLKAEESTGWDIGVEQSLSNDSILIDITYFQSDLENEIFTDFGVFPATARNRLGKSEREGVEVTLEANVTDTLDISASYTYTKTEQGGREEVRRPEQAASFDLTYHPNERTNLNVNLIYNGDMQDDNFGTFPASRVTLDSYTLVNVSGSYDVNDAVTLYAKATNLLDEDYEEIYGYRATGLGVFAGLKVSLGG